MTIKILIGFIPRECQKEHWLYNHQNHCQNFSRKKTEDCSVFERAMDEIGAALMGDKLVELKRMNVRMEQSFFWALFKSDRGMLVDRIQMAEIASGEKLANLPGFPVRQDQPNGWIDEYLNYLSFLIQKLIGFV